MIWKNENKGFGSCGQRRALSLTEALVAMAIALVFMGSITTAYVQISKAADHAEAQVRAHTRARVALDIVARDLARIRTDPILANQEFYLTSVTLSFGDNVDNDLDGSVDEEALDGLDDDGDWSIDSDKHAEIATNRFERPDYVGEADFGDLDVDEDCLFSRDQLTFRVPADPSGLDPAERITYRVDTFDGVENVLIREVTTNPGTVNEATSTEPIVFEVLSFDVLAWNPNDNVVSPVSPQRPYWQEEWDSDLFQFPLQRPLGAPFGVPPFEFPAAVLVAVTVNAEGLPIEDIAGWPLGTGNIKTVRLTMVATLNEVVKSPIYRDYVRAPF